MESTNVNLKVILSRLYDVKEELASIYRTIKNCLGSDANYVRDWADLRRVERDEPNATEIEGDALFEELLQSCWRSGKDYVWNYHDQRFRITPFKSGTTDDGGFIFYYGMKHSLVNFASVTRDAVDTDCSVWEAIVARMHGIADGYCSALKQSKQEHVLADMPAPDTEPDLKWKDGYSIDPAEAVKVPDGADAVPDGTLACADPVVDQAEEPISSYPEPNPLNFEKAFSDEVEISDNTEEAVEQMKQLGHCDIVFCPSPELLAVGYENEGYIRWYAIGPKGPCFLIDCRWDLCIPVKSSDGGEHCVYADRANPDIQGDVEKVINWVQSEIKEHYSKDEEPKPKPNWKEKRVKEKDLIRAGGGPIPDGNSDMTDEQKEEYRRWKEKRLAEEDLKWKQSAESPQRYG